jgi:Na+/proline symporter
LLIVSLAISFLLLSLGYIYFKGRDWSSSYLSFLFADRSLKIQSSSLAIASHWFWAIAIFVGPSIAYNWGITGLLWFVIPNALSLLVVSYILYFIRDKYPNGYSLTQYIKDNFSNRLSKLYQLEFILVSFAALLLAFTAISKLWNFTGLNSVLDTNLFTLSISIITLLFTIKGGIRTSIFTGSVQTLLWLIFLSVTYLVIAFSDLSFISYGKNNLTTVFNESFIKTFAIAWFISIMVGATGHGMMWQKSFSMKKENILPSFGIAALLFSLITFMMGGLGLFAFSNSLPLTSSVDTTQLISLQYLFGSLAIVIFSIILVGQTSTVIDSALNYISNLVSMEWLHWESISLSRFIMLLFTLIAWSVSWLNLEIWTILMLMGSVRITMFIPLVLHSLGIKFKESIAFYSSILAILVSFTLAYLARIDKIPVYDMYSVLSAFFIPLVVIITSKLFTYQSTQK